MNEFRYDRVQDASMQLDNTVMMTKERGPIYITSYDGWEFNIQELLSYESEVVDIREVGLTFEPMLLGYVNYGHQVAYLGRRPRRMWKAGLSHDNIRAISGYLDDDILTQSALGKCLINDYPSLKEAFDSCYKRNTAFAFNRDIALSSLDGGVIDIEYKGMQIGNISEDLDFLINDKYEYLTEVLMEAINEEG